MDQFEETVVNPNISLKNFEVKVPEENNSDSRKEIIADKIPTKTKKNYKSLLLLAILASLLIYQITIIL